MGEGGSVTWEVGLADQILRCALCVKADIGGAYRVLPCRIHRVDGQAMGWNQAGRQMRLTPIDVKGGEHKLAQKRIERRALLAREEGLDWGQE